MAGWSVKTKSISIIREQDVKSGQKIAIHSIGAIYGVQGADT